MDLKHLLTVAINLVGILGALWELSRHLDRAKLTQERLTDAVDRLMATMNSLDVRLRWLERIHGGEEEHHRRRHGDL
jgi:hypothetical protein